MRLLGQTFTVATAIGLALTIAPACVDNDQSIYIRQFMAPSTTRTAGGCTYTNDPSQASLLEPTLDVALSDNYVGVALVGNQMIQRSDNTAPRIESNKAHIEGAIVRVTDANGGSISEFTAQGSGFADASNGNVASYGLFGFTVLDAPTVAKAKASLPAGGTKLLIANIKVFGETLGGDDLESGEYALAIRICDGCLISFSDKDDPATPNVVDCNLNSSAAGATGGASTQDMAPCNFGQDEGVPCTLCKGFNDRCKIKSP